MKSSTNHSLKLLLLDDKASHRLLIESILKESLDGVMIKMAQSEEEFQKHIHRFKPDVVLSSYIQKNYSAERALNWLHETKQHKPVILVSDKVSEHVEKELMREGVEDFVPNSQLARLPSAVMK